jgi:hypothetical protein
LKSEVLALMSWLLAWMSKMCFDFVNIKIQLNLFVVLGTETLSPKSKNRTH